MKRLLAVVLSAAMIFSSGFSSFATEGTETFLSEESDAAAAASSDEEIIDAATGADTETLLEDQGTEASSEASSEASTEEILEEAPEASSESSSEGASDELAAEASTEASSVVEDLLEEGEDADKPVDEEAAHEPVEPVKGTSEYFTVNASGVLALKEGGHLQPSVTIPTQIGGVYVKTIPAGIFSISDQDRKEIDTTGKTVVRRVRFEENSQVTTIADGAFESSSLEHITLPASITEIGNNVFRYSSLNDIVIEGNVTSIGDYAFENTHIKNISGDYVTSVGVGAFDGCTDLGKADFPRLESIGKYAFKSCTALGNKQSFPETLTYIGVGAFQDCGFTKLDLTTVKGDVVISTGAFEGNVKLTDVKLPDSMESVSDRLFYKCTNLKNVTLGNSLKNIGKESFAGCGSIESIILQKNVSRIDEGAFKDCGALKTIIIWHEENPDNPLSIAESAFPLITGVTLKGNCEAAEVYANKRGYKYVSLSPTHSVSVNPVISDKQGAITLSTRKAVEGAIVKVTVTPAEGYSLQSIELVANQNVELTNVSNTAKERIFSFKMPAVDVNVSAKFAENSKIDIKKLSYDIRPVEGYSADMVDNKVVFNLSGRQSELIIMAGTEVTPKWYWNYTSSDANVVAVSDTGFLRAVKKGSAKITATLRSNPNTKVTVNVVVESEAVIKGIELKIDEPSRAICFKENIGGESIDVIQYDVAALKAGARSFNVGITAKAEGVDARNLYVKSNWSTVDKDLASLKSATSVTNSNTVTVKKNSFGETMLTVSVMNSDEKSPLAVNTKRFIVRVIDARPRIGNTTITVNSNSTKGTALDVVPVYRYEILDDALELCYDVEGNKDCENLTVEYEGGKYYIRNVKNGKTFTKTYSGKSQLYLRGRYKNDGTSFAIPLTKVSVVNTALNPTIKTSGKINLFYNSEAAPTLPGVFKVTQSIKNVAVEKVELVSTANHNKAGSEMPDTFARNFDVSKTDNQTFSITKSTRFAKVNGKSVNSGYIYIYYEGYAVPVKKAITVSTCDTAPSYVLKSTKATANTNAENQEYYLELVDKKTKKKVLSLENLEDIGYTATDNGIFDEIDMAYAQANNKIKLRVNGTPSKGKAVFYIRLSDWSRYLKFTFNLAVTSKEPGVKLSATTASLNKAYASQSAVITAKIDSKDAVITGFDSVVYSGKAKNAAGGNALAAAMTTEGNAIKINLPADVKAGTYPFKARVNIRYNGSGIERTLKAASFSVVVDEKNPLVKLKNSTFTLNSKYPGYEVISTTYNIGNLPTATNGEIIGTPTVDALKGATAFDKIAELTIDPVTRNMSVRLTNQARNLKGSYTYRVKGLQVKAGDDIRDVAAFNITLKFVNAEPTIKVTSTGTLNPVDRTSQVTYKATVNNIKLDIDKVDIWEVDSKTGGYCYYKNGDKRVNYSPNFEVSGTNKVRYLQAKDGTAIKNNSKYKVTLVYTLKDAPTIKPIEVKFTVTPKQSIPAIKVAGTTYKIYAGQENRSINVKIGKPAAKKGQKVANAEMTTPVFASGTPASIKKAFKIRSFDQSTNTMTLELTNPAAIKADKTYTLNFVTTYRNQATNTTGKKFSVKVNVKK